MVNSRRLLAALVLLNLCLVVGAQDVDSIPPREAVRRADRAVAQGRYYEAIELYSDAQAQNPSYYEALYGLARTYFLLGEYDEALVYAERARPFARENVELANLQGQLLLGTGRLEEAAATFRSVLTNQPNNLEARLGLAELELARGRNDAAVATLEDTLRLYPENRRALLSLAVVYDYRGQPEVSETYIDQALRFHRTDPAVHVLAAEHYLEFGEIELARGHAMTALSLSGDNVEALLILARSYLADGLPSEALSVAEQVLAADQQRVEAFYLAGIAHAELGSSDMAVRSMQRALRLDPQDELIRLSAESLLLDRYGIDSRLRRQFAEFHRLRGEDLVEMNQIPHAAVAFRRALRLYPFLPDARRQLAELYRIQGFRSRYLQELEVLSELGEVDQEVRDRIEVYRSILSESVAADWGVEQFEIGRDRYRLALFARESPIGNRLPGIATAVGRYLRFLLLGYENVEVAETIRTVDRDSDAFAAARELDADYYAILRLQRGDRAFGLTADVYVGRTGTLLRQFQSVTAGNHMVENAAYRVSRDMRDALPFRATLLERDGNLGLISAGAVDGIEAGDTYAVLAESAVLLAPREFRLEYPEHEILGDFVVTRVDDLVSEGEIKRGGLFDMVNAGDLVVVAPDEEEEEATLSPTVLYPPLYNRVRRLRN